MKILSKILLLLSMIVLVSCNNFRSRSFGGEQIINLPKGEKLIDCTWKHYNLWYLTEPMDSSYIPKTKIFRECSGMGMFEGTLIFKESK